MKKKKIYNIKMVKNCGCYTRRPKEKKKGANTKNSTWKLPFYKKAELIKWNYVEEELKSFHDKSGHDMLINGYTKTKFFKENFKPP